MEVRKVSSKAQITLPKDFAGKLVSIERLSDGVLQIKSGEFIADSERMLHSAKYKDRLKAFDKWMDKHDLQETDIEHVDKGKK
jgi:bifunctional DNA-binding transcriptional regulator/antitoxin component of YhaV-PrlF toxin-antitoxin module